MRFTFKPAELAALRPKAAPQPVRPRDAITFGTPPLCPNHYVVENHREAYRRVLWSNPTPNQDRSRDVLGPTGHLERANAWTHITACGLFCGYALARVWLIDQHSLASQLSGISINVSAIVFAVSAMYHVFSAVPGLAAYMRYADIVSIYMAMAVSCVADAALATNDFANVGAQTAIDPLLATTVLGAFFTVRRFLLPPDETRTDYFEDACQLGLYRFQHSDLEHAGLRTGGIVAIIVQWVLLLPAVFDNLSASVAALYLSGRVLGTAMLILGVLFDNAQIPDRALAGKEGYWNRTGAACGCASKRLGCVMGAHAWWHVLALVATVILTASREYGISQMAHERR